MDILKTPPQVIPYSPIIPCLFMATSNRIAGKYYGMLGGHANNIATAVVNKLYALPFLVLVNESFDRISVVVTTGAAGNCRLGIYASGTDGRPTTLVLDAGAVDTAVAENKEITINQALSPGLYWLVAVFDATPAMRVIGSSLPLLGLEGSLDNGGASVFGYTTFNYAVLPATHPTFTPNNVNTCPGVCLRRA